MVSKGSVRKIEQRHMLCHATIAGMARKFELDNRDTVTE